MKKTRSIFSIFLSLLIVAVMIPYAEETASADTVASYSLNGNSGATVTLNSDVSSASINDSSLADVTANGKTVTVSGKDGAVGIAEVTVNGSETFEVPIGYTTFIFNGDNLTVYEGSDDKYEVYGIRADSSDEQALESVSDGSGNAVYTVDADAGTAGNININGGTISLKAASDGIQAAQDITITNGTFNIITGSGYNDSSFDKNTMSCKGIVCTQSKCRFGRCK